MVVHDLLAFALPFGLGFGHLVFDRVELVTHLSSYLLDHLLVSLFTLLIILSLAYVVIFIKLFFVGYYFALDLLDAVLMDLVLAVKLFTRAFEITLGFFSLLLSTG
jgi:hypothetical protein